MIQITSVRHNWPNQPGFCLNRPQGHQDYTFVHFTTSVELYLSGSKIAVPEHACIIYKPQTPQHFLCPHGMIHDWFHFTGVSERMFSELDLPTDILLTPKGWSFIADTVEEMENEFYAKREYHGELIEAKIKELFIKLSRSVKSKYPETVKESFTSELRQLRTEISQNLSHDWTVAEMASKLMLSQSRFAHLYHAFYGTTPIEDLIRMRIIAAQNALAFTQSSIYEISESLGYRNVTHFCRQFRKIVELTPSQYRRNCKLKGDSHL